MIAFDMCGMVPREQLIFIVIINQKKEKTMRAVRETKTFVLLSTMLACVICSGVQSVRAGTAIESFDYPAGSALIGQSGGTGWNGAWTTVTGATTNSVISAGSLTYSGITSSGNKMTSVASGNGDSRALRTLATGYNSGTVYFSTLAQNLNDSVRYLGLALYESASEKVLLGQGSNFSNWTLSRVLIDGVTGTLDSGIDSSDLALLVLKVDFNASSVNSTFENVTFWVNPDLSLPEDITTAVSGQAYSTDRDYGTITRVRVGGGATSGDNVAPMVYMDEVRVSTISPFAAPALQIAVDGSDALLSWPTTGWTLQKAITLGTENLWIDITGTETLTATNLPVAPTGEFFRLYQE